MKKGILFCSLLISVGMVHASELFWLASPTVTTTDGDFTWTSAQLYANTGETYGFNYGGTKVGSTVSASDMQTIGYWITDLGNTSTSTYSFYVELSNGSTTYRSSVSSTQGGTSYGDISSYVYDSSSFVPQTLASPYNNFSNFTQSNITPEPTTGLLMLLGMAGLALKRKREQV